MCDNSNLGVGTVPHSDIVLQQEIATPDSNTAVPAFDVDDNDEVQSSSTSRQASIGFENAWPIPVDVTIEHKFGVDIEVQDWRVVLPYTTTDPSLDMICHYETGMETLSY